MSDQPQPKQKPEQPKTPEQDAQGKTAPANTKPPSESGLPKDAQPKPASSAPAEKPAQPPPAKPAPGDDETERAMKVPDKSTVDAAKETAKAAEPAKDAPPAASTPPAASSAPSQAAPTPDQPAADKPAASPAPAESKPAAAPSQKPGTAPLPTDRPTGSDASEKSASSPTATAPLNQGAGAQPSAPAQSAASMQQRCPNCGHRNRPGVLICENCGTNLVTGKSSVAGTRDLLREQEAQEAAASTASAKPGTAPLIDSQELKAVQSAGSTVFEDTMVLRIEIEGGATPILVYPKQEIIFGRRDPTSGGMPDVDLTPYAGYRMGVSRRHAAIRLQEKRLDVSDLGSSNGTFLNGTRLSAHRPYQLRDGDEVRLGQMVMRVYFQTNTGRK